VLADAMFGHSAVATSVPARVFTRLERYFARPRDDLPYDAARCGKRLAGVVVKSPRRLPRAAKLLAAPVFAVHPNGVTSRKQQLAK